MAEGEKNQNIQEEVPNEEEERLKYLDFVRAAGVYAVDSFSTLYLYAKDISGPLKPGVETVEVTVKEKINVSNDEKKSLE
ncbi:hypothetical protein P3X46_018481 [Hevea brasiliensis]|uniref:Uncharacterized protein n=1 Tax=Hevea brasiliensis TaxID=3981 RepID=A0ABQ9LQW1_HEVBR|nr:hypothetical protein P3X46_018481 [Hevea brasiliensis]